ncbi:hypothetical protein CBR_g54179 [Chara braunii]|uniref:aspartyl aminopeptidase n=1 Tax=Chara braunii TaxID=69332 RepID=A0A388K768_CHABU|nr:hypothetical protein CBR_g54179 [Chara braunii]|eukprot:GBG65888.1 hypothetical protein CBR_g54179 [Chara braunii]
MALHGVGILVLVLLVPSFLDNGWYIDLLVGDSKWLDLFPALAHPTQALISLASPRILEFVRLYSVDVSPPLIAVLSFDQWSDLLWTAANDKAGFLGLTKYLVTKAKDIAGEDELVSICIDGDVAMKEKVFIDLFGAESNFHAGLVQKDPGMVGDDEGSGEEEEEEDDSLALTEEEKAYHSKLLEEGRLDKVKAIAANQKTCANKFLASLTGEEMVKCKEKALTENTTFIRGNYPLTPDAMKLPVIGDFDRTKCSVSASALAVRGFLGPKVQTAIAELKRIWNVGRPYLKCQCVAEGKGDSGKNISCCDDVFWYLLSDLHYLFPEAPTLRARARAFRVRARSTWRAVVLSLVVFAHMREVMVKMAFSVAIDPSRTAQNIIDDPAIMLHKFPRTMAKFILPARYVRTAEKTRLEVVPAASAKKVTPVRGFFLFNSTVSNSVRRSDAWQRVCLSQEGGEQGHKRDQEGEDERESERERAHSIQSAMSPFADSKRGSTSVVHDFLRFINNAWTPFHATREVERMLLDAGYQQLSERDHWPLELGGKYFVTRNMSSIIAFSIGHRFVAGEGFWVVGAHTDSPCPKLKPVTKVTKAGCLMVGVQPYGGGIWHTWFDRDLSVAGRVMVKKSADQLDMAHCHAVPNGNGNGHAVANGNGYAAPNGNGHAVANGNGYAAPNGNGHAVANGNGYAAPNGNGHAFANGNGHAVPNGNGHAFANGNGHAVPNGNGNGHAVTNGNGHAVPNGNGHVVSNGNGHFGNGNGHISANGHSQKTPVIASELVLIRRPIMRIPTLAIHLDRSVNDGFAVNFQNHMGALLATSIKAEMNRVAQLRLGEEASFSGNYGEEDSSPVKNTMQANGKVSRPSRSTTPTSMTKVEEQPSHHAVLLQALVESTSAQDALYNERGVRMVALFDNEEVGSNSAQGACSTLMRDAMTRITEWAAIMQGSHYGISGLVEQASQNSFVVSADMGHALHPNYQDFVVRSDLPCGSTIGPSVSTRLGIRTVDVGAPQLSMHSVREMCGADDIDHSFRHLKAYFEDVGDLLLEIVVDE